MIRLIISSQSRISVAQIRHNYMTSCESILSSLNDADHMLLMMCTTGGQKDQFQRDASHQCIGA